MIVRRERAAWLFAAAVLVYPLPYYFTFAEPRYRHAVEPLLLLISMYFVLRAVRDLQGSLLNANLYSFSHMAMNRRSL
jgi:hypothetical protein